MGWWHYLLLVNFYLVLFFVFYALLLSKETFFHLNRAYLVAASLLSFFIPLIQSNWVKELFITRQVQSTIYNNQVILYRFKPVESVLTLGNVFAALYITVTLLLCIRLIWQLVTLKNIINKPQPSAAYSFFKKISLGTNLSKQGIIAEHEQVHAREWHSADVMIIEVVMIINWFNPVVYLYRFSIKYIHEFIADRQVLESGTNKADYALLLLNQTFDTPSNGLVSNFYSSSLLKQRILMLQKDRSKQIALAKYGLSAPLFILMMVFSSATVNNSKAIVSINKKVNTIVTLPANPQQLALNIKRIANNIDNNSAIADEANYIDEQPRESANLIAVGRSVEVIANTSNSGKEVLFTPFEKQPEFPGGIDKFYEIVKSNMQYPEEMYKSKIEGRAYIQFVVEKDGSVTGFKTIRAPGYGSEEEATRVLSLIPKWNPGYQNGRAVSVKYTMPIIFELEPNTGIKDTAAAHNFQKGSANQFIAGTKSVSALDVLKVKVSNPIIGKPESSLTTMAATLTRRIIGGITGLKQDDDE